ncbi:PilZ domain-containing protein [Parasphingopyxis sp.]|uniref:PilZ domain-containing protein n=1 Tax=Parasphingopyxis sp. TaxID=1920299 RepID=UPI002639DBE5|nr:PilZ domain-containing protein [Parasphingopyxis sp.]
MQTVAALNRRSDPEFGGDNRAEPRMRLLYRTAKLIWDDHEILTVVRNVSRKGLAIRTFGAIDFPAQMKIELANGTVLPVKKEWQNEDSCGASFRSPIDVEQFLATAPPGMARRPLRARVDYRATLKDTDWQRPALIRDIGVGGALLELDYPLDKYRSPELAIGSLGSRTCVVRWSRRNCFGVEFSHPFPFTALAEWVVRIARNRNAGDQAPHSAG